MSKIGLVIRREFESRVKKKSFLLVTILVPLIFPAVIGIMVYFAMEEEKSAEQKQVYVVDESGFDFENDRKYAFDKMNMSLDEAKVMFSESDAYALLYVPKMDIENPDGLTLYMKNNPSLDVSSFFENIVESQIRDRKLKASGITEEQLDKLKTNISLRAINMTDSGEEKESSAGIAFGLAYAFSFLVYLFVLIYGSQIMQGVIEEKSNKIVEIVVSSIKPFQLMIGKVIGVAAVGIVQFAIWVVLIGVLSSVVFSVFNLTPEDIQAAQNTMPSSPNQELVSSSMNPEMLQTMQAVYDIPYGYYISIFIFFFISGYLLYGALFAAVGSAVDNISDAQQFTLPVTMPMIIGFLGTFMFVMREPDGNVSFWLSIIPFTSPVAMMARVAFGVPTWELILSMALMIAGFVFTIWLAGRIYRIGILMHGTKVSYKTLFKWIKTSN
ncbi:ABC transporter permease [Marivirga atlantica]|jgi:ABC-2 type transport system permease protein|uniref:ABC transporter permease n=1 Tax=Marivirga atlantica TaxID=1548457 RepID=A0A937DDI2_9BACT|nr:ABC transporter permease [Marivirga atlantica]MBL0764252.1 ABC transporter permease [Marivirga atlantica]